MGILITFQGDKIGTIDIGNDGTFVYTGDTSMLQNIVRNNNLGKETPAEFLERLPKIFHGTLSAISYTSKNPPEPVQE